MVPSMFKGLRTLRCMSPQALRLSLFRVVDISIFVEETGELCCFFDVKTYFSDFAKVPLEMHGILRKIRTPQL
jgi:hypothetical protein